MKARLASQPQVPACCAAALALLSELSCWPGLSLLFPAWPPAQLAGSSPACPCRAAQAPTAAHAFAAACRRADALGFLELLVGWRPDLIAAGFLAPALSHFGDLLSKGARGRSLSAGSLSALHRTVGALDRFLQRLPAAEPAAAGAAAGPAAEGAGTRSAAGAAGGPGPAALPPLFRARCGWGPLGVPGGGLAAALGGAAAPGGVAGSASDGGGAEEAAARALLGHLLECWSDCGPSQLAAAPELALAQCLLSTLRWVLGAGSRAVAWGSPSCPCAGW